MLNTKHWMMTKSVPFNSAFDFGCKVFTYEEQGKPVKYLYSQLKKSLDHWKICNMSREPSHCVLFG
ncbi:MAG: hypothetical protein CMB80_11835 [Flammeovirgaceae bacterium]|nr:hypothetical protein [Flammeovirgaceae bacterium]